jgi:RNA recognition motif-containing protein
LNDHSNAGRSPSTNLQDSTGLASPVVLGTTLASPQVPFSEAPAATENALDQRTRRTAYLGNLSSDVTEDDLRDFFADCGVMNVRIADDKDGRREDFAKIEFDSFPGMRRALNLLFEGEEIRFSLTKPIDFSPLLGVSVATSGRFSVTTQRALQARINDLGGLNESRVTSYTDILIATEQDVEASAKKVDEALFNNVPIVSINWLFKTEEDNARADETQFSLVTRLTSPLQHQPREHVSNRVGAHGSPKGHSGASGMRWDDATEERAPTPKLEPEAKTYRFFLKTKGLQDSKILVRPETTFEQLADAFRILHSLARTQPVTFVFNSKRLLPMGTVQNTELEDMDEITVLLQ